MRILVTGGNGLVGTALHKVIHQESSSDTWIFVGREDADLRDSSAVERLFDRHRPDVVVHLAARCGGLYMNMEHNKTVFEDNTQMNMNVISSAEKHGVKRCIAMLSTCIFPDPAPCLPLTEDMIHMGPPAITHEGYAMSKRFLEFHCRLSNMQSICLIPTNIFGPNDNFGLEASHVIPALIHKCYLARENNKDFVVSGTGTAMRQFIYSEDLARIIVWAVHQSTEKQHQMYICSPSITEEISIGSVASYIAEYFDYKNRMVYDTSFVDGQIRKTASNEALLKAMQRNPTPTDFKDALHTTINWFVDNFETSRH